MITNRIAFTPFRGIDASSATSAGVSACFGA